MSKLSDKKLLLIGSFDKEEYCNQLYFNNIVATGGKYDNVLYIRAIEGASLLIDGLVVKDSLINAPKLIYWDTIISKFTLINSSFTNLTINSQNSLINIDSTNILSFSNLNFSQIKGSTEDSVDISALLINNYILDGSENSMISNINIDNSKMGLLNFYSVSGSPSNYKLFSISDLVYSNWDFYNGYNLIAFNAIETTLDFRIQLKSIAFLNISFYFSGNLIYMKSQIPGQLIISDSSATNVTGGSIWIEAFNKQNYDLNANMKLLNFTTKNVNSKYSSFLMVNEGSNLEIRNSNFNYVMSYESGSVLTAGYQKSTTSIYDSFFQYNSANDGGVFNIESESIVKIYNSTISNNFAFEGGVIKASTNGYFELYNTTITQNYALSIPIAELIDVVSSPIINNWFIHNNSIISSKSISDEINKNCT